MTLSGLPRKFSPADGVFLLDGTQYAVLAKEAGPSFRRATAITLSMHAHEAALTAGHETIAAHYPFIDMEELGRIEAFAWEQANRWLRDLRHQIAIEGIDLAEIDAQGQHLFFRFALYLDGLAGRMVEALPGIKRFYVLQTETPQPLEHDFNSDVGAAILRFVCEQRGRRVEVIASPVCITSFSAHFQRRPFTEPWIPPYILPPSDPGKPSGRVGFLPSTVPEGLRIIHDVRTLNAELRLFYSSWPVSAPRSAEPEPLLPLERQWSDGVAEKLAAIRQDISLRKAESGLPASIIGNPHLAFQFDFILGPRWLGYANYIARAARHVAANPLALMIVPEHYTFEGSALAALYRRQGTPILLAPEGCGQIVNHITAPRPTDLSMQWSRLGAKRMVVERMVASVFVTGRPMISSPVTEESLAIMADIRRRKGERKLVVYVSNAAEVGCLPLLDHARHAESVRAVAQIPAHLADKVWFAVRRKSSTGCESVTIHRELHGIAEESLTLLDGLSFAQCIELADCVLGIDQATSGYYDAFESGTPLVHFQTTGVPWQQPDLPDDIFNRVDSAEAAWREIEAILFDPTHRAAVIERQGGFAAADRAPAFTGMASPVQMLIHHLLNAAAEPHNLHDERDRK